MQIIVERIENPSQEFWIWEKKITNKHEGRIYPSTISNVGSGKSVAVYQKDKDENVTQIAQLQLPDYEKLKENYTSGKQINLDYTYIDDFAWLGNKKPYEVEGLPYEERESFSARCAIFNNLEKKDYIHIMQSKIKKGDMDFFYAGFFNIHLDFCELNIERGNLDFSYVRFYDARIALGPVLCGGNQYYSPEISFRYIKADNVEIDTVLMTQSLSLDFFDAQTSNTTISLDPLPIAFKNICFAHAIVNKVTITNAEIDTVDAGGAEIFYLEFKRCIFRDFSEISGNIQELHIDDCLNTTVIKLSLPRIQKLTFSGTINNGKLCFVGFSSVIKAILKSISESSKDIDQLLMLKENFRQTGEYENEDICHLCFQKLKTKDEHSILKKMGRNILDGISGYGTKPLRMLLVIFVIIVLFGTLYYFVPCLSYHGVDTWLEHIYASGITFFAVGYGDLFPQNIITKMISLIEAFLGVTATSYFLVLLSRKVIR